MPDPASTTALKGASDVKTVESSPIVITLDENSFKINFLCCTANAWKCIIDDPILKVKNSKNGQIFIEYSQIMMLNSDAVMNFPVITDSISKLFVNRSLLSQTDHELLITDVHNLRMSQEFVTHFVKYLQSQILTADANLCKVLCNMWLRRITTAMMHVITDLIKCTVQSSKVEQAGLSDTDQNVLYHICGYMVRKASVACKKYKNLKQLEGLIKCLTTKVPGQSGHFVEHYQNWVSKQTRGGLLFPIPALYLLVRELDLIFRKMAFQTGYTQSVNKSILQTTMLESVLVQYYWNQIILLQHADESSSLPLLDYFICLFITIKGFAVVRKQRDELASQTKSKILQAKQSKSLRGKLKKCDTSRK